MAALILQSIGGITHWSSTVPESSNDQSAAALHADTLNMLISELMTQFMGPCCRALGLCLDMGARGADWLTLPLTDMLRALVKVRGWQHA